MAIQKGIVWNTRTEDVERWRGVFLEEMRLRGASGHQMGEAWATIEAHVQETGDTLTDAFGDPVAYAASLTDDERSPRAIAVTYGSTLVGIIGFYLASFMPLTRLSDGVAVSCGSLALVPLGVLAMLGIVVAQRRMQTHMGQGFILFVLAFMGFQMGHHALHTWPRTAFSTPAWALWALCSLFLLVATAGCLAWVRDRTIDPRTGQAPSMVPAFWWWVLAVSPLWGPGALLFFRWLAHR